MSCSKQITTSRNYQPVPEHCIKALALLLQVPARKKGGVRAAPDDTVKELNGYDAFKKHNS
jgi:hypothetical protein